MLFVKFTVNLPEHLLLKTPLILVPVSVIFFGSLLGLILLTSILFTTSLHLRSISAFGLKAVISVLIAGITVVYKDIDGTFSHCKTLKETLFIVSVPNFKQSKLSANFT